ncbi:hypothetical protein I7I53_10431 [Histoplasma capsulatum var. duboisii H88]|uniref:Uncharacterized protein n=1 Tax=Ajellomyces capsulatus (strain H88) TaxID=544711 RepID=A0A8A1LDQ1_AJEC8|nr:hypothetical protein I7I53_10431 [Histoplasma capsulatum var. duboisii H88]
MPPLNLKSNTGCGGKWEERGGSDSQTATHDAASERLDRGKATTRNEGLEVAKIMGAAPEPHAPRLFPPRWPAPPRISGWLMS